MKKLSCLLFVLALASSANSFAAKVKEGGVGVGNGLKAFLAPQGFSVQYAPNLNLLVNSASEFSISNASLVHASGRNSKVSFLTTKAEVSTGQELRQRLNQLYPGLPLAEVQFPGASGLFWEEKKDGGLSGQYFLLTANGNFVEAAVEAYEDGHGLSLIAPIVRTFAYDTQAPVVTEVYAENTEWPAGTTQKVFFRVTDENSGLSGRIGASFTGIDSFAQGNVNVHIYSSSELKHEGGSIYSVEFPVNQFLPRERYVLQEVSIYDNAGNIDSLWAGGYASEGKYYVEKKYEQKSGGPSPAILQVKVTGAGSRDISDPKFLEIRAPEAEWEAGTTQRVYVRIQDELSGVNVDTLGSVFFCLTPNFPLPGNYQYLESHSPRAEGNNWYSVAYDIPAHAPAGEFALKSLGVYDHAGNYSSLFAKKLKDKNYYSYRTRTDLPVFRVKIRNSSREDRSPPSIEELRLESNAWKAGETQRLHVRSRDDISGLSLDRLEVLFMPDKDRSDVFRRRWIYATAPSGKLVPEGNDWYQLAIEVGAFLPEDNYTQLARLLPPRRDHG